MAWPSTRYKTAAPGGTWTPDDFNGWQDQFIRPDGLVGDDLSSALAGNLAISQSGTPRRGYDEVLADQRDDGGTPLVSPTLRLQTNGLVSVFYSVDAKNPGGADPNRLRVVVRDASNNWLSSRTYALTADTWVTSTPETFLVVPSTGLLELSMLVYGFDLTRMTDIRNIKLWAMAYSF